MARLKDEALDLNTTKLSNHCVSDKSSATDGAPVMKAVATLADSKAREAADGFVADEGAVATREVEGRGLFRVLRPQEPEWEAAVRLVMRSFTAAACGQL